MCTRTADAQVGRDAADRPSLGVELLCIRPIQYQPRPTQMLRFSLPSKLGDRRDCALRPADALLFRDGRQDRKHGVLEQAT